MQVLCTFCTRRDSSYDNKRDGGGGGVPHNLLQEIYIITILLIISVTTCPNRLNDYA